MNQLTKTALITGATSGIGLALARVFAEHKYDLVISARDENNLSETAAELTLTYGIDVKYVSADLSEAEAPKKLYDFCKTQNLEIDALVNNAGFAIYGPFANVPTSKHIDIIRLNMLAPTALIGLFLPELTLRKGKILNIASTAAFQPGPFMSVYYASKAYVLSLSEALHSELKEQGVSVSCLCPGPVITNFQKQAGTEFRTTKLIRYGFMLTADKVAKIAYAGLMKNKNIIIPGLLNKFLAFWAQILPRKLTTSVSKWTLER